MMKSLLKNFCRNSAVVLSILISSTQLFSQTPNGTLDFGNLSNNTTATTANTGLGGIRIGSGGGSFTIQNPGQAIGIEGELRGIAPTSGSINSAGVTSAEFGTATTTFTIVFDLYLSGGASGTWYFFAGNGSSYNSAQTTGFTGNQTFTGLRFTFGASNTITTNNRSAGNWNTSGISGTPFTQNTSYKVEIIGNNGSAVANYSGGSIAVDKYDLWVNDVLVGDDLNKAQLANGNAINAFRFYGENSVGNVAQLAIDNVVWYNTCFRPSAATPVVSGATVPGTVGTTLNYQISATNAPTSYAISSGSLPLGLSLNTTSGSISGTPTTAGNSSVDVTATNATGTSTPATLNFEIAKGNQTLTFAPLANAQYGDATFNLTATASSGLTVAYESSNPLVATVSGNIVTIVGEGTTNITASQAGDANYNSATAVFQSLTVTKRQLTIAGLSGTSKVYDALTTATATGIATLNGILPGDESNVALTGTPTFAFTTSTVGTNKTIDVTGYALTGASADNYILHQPTLTADITEKTIAVSGVTAADKVYDGTTVATISGGILIGVETLDIANVNVAATGTFDSATVGVNKPVTIALTGSAASNYSLTQPGITATITKADQTITFNALPSLDTNTTTVDLNLYASATSGLAVTYTSSNSLVASVSGNILTVIGAGATTLTATQAGNENYNPSGNAIQNINVTFEKTLLAGRDFQTTTTGGTTLQAAPNTPKIINANFGSGALYLNGTNSSSDFIAASSGNELNSFGGTAINTEGTGFSTINTGASALALLGGAGLTANGKSAVFMIDMSDYANLEISYAAQRTSTGFTTNTWEYSSNGTVWTPIAILTNIPSSFAIMSLPIISGLDNVPTCFVRLTVNGASGNLGNNRFDNIKFKASIFEVTWDGTEWSNTVGPDATINAIIQGPYVTATNGAFTAKNLTIATGGSLTISSGTTINVINALNNQLSSAAVLIENNGNLIQSSNVTNTGSITVHRESNELMRLDYTLWSSPVDGQNLLDFSSLTLLNRFYIYNPTTNLYNSVVPSVTDFSEGIGYLIRMPNNHPILPTVWQGTFEGVPHNGNVLLTVANNTFNAVGNPYPSTIDADAFIDVNGITSPLYFWRKTNNLATTSYATYTKAGGV